MWGETLPTRHGDVLQGMKLLFVTLYCNIYGLDHNCDHGQLCVAFLIEGHWQRGKGGSRQSCRSRLCCSCLLKCFPLRCLLSLSPIRPTYSSRLRPLILQPGLRSSLDVLTHFSFLARVQTPTPRRCSAPGPQRSYSTHTAEAKGSLWLSQVSGAGM